MISVLMNPIEYGSPGLKNTICTKSKKIVNIMYVSQTLSSFALRFLRSDKMSQRIIQK